MGSACTAFLPRRGAAPSWSSVDSRLERRKPDHDRKEGQRERERERETDKMGEDEDGDGERQRSVASGETTRCKLDPRERADEDAGGHHHG